MRHVVALALAATAWCGLAYVVGAGASLLGALVLLVSLELALVMFAFESSSEYESVRSRTLADLSGQRGRVVIECSPRGQVRLNGELWQAVAVQDALLRGDEVVVTKADGLLLTVSKAP